jgi:hypothetical protein
MMHEKARRIDHVLTLFYVLAAAGSLVLGLAPTLGLRCDACTGGLLSLSMPWIAAAFYSGLAFLSVRFRSSPLLSLAPGFFVFVHASLIVEMALSERLCPGCLVVAAVAIGAAVTQVRRDPAAWRATALALVLGGAAGFVTPFERTDELVTLKLWPSRMLESAPAWVNRDDMTRCDHPAGVRVLIYEKDCKS